MMLNKSISKLVLPVVIALITLGIGLNWLIPSFQPMPTPSVESISTLAITPTSFATSTPVPQTAILWPNLMVESTSTLVFTPTSLATLTPVPLTATPQPSQGSSFQQPILTSDQWGDPKISVHPIFQKWIAGNSSMVFPGEIASQRLAFYEYADGHQELIKYSCAQGSGQVLDRALPCIRLKYSDESQELNPQTLSDCSLQCMLDMHTVEVQGTTGYIGWFQSGSGGNWTELNWRIDGVTVTLSASGDWPHPDEMNPRRLDEMVLWVAESLGRVNITSDSNYLPATWRKVDRQDAGLSFGVPRSWLPTGDTYWGADGYIRLERYNGPGAQLDEACEAEANREPQLYGNIPAIYSLHYDDRLGDVSCLIVPDHALGPAAQASLLILDPTSTGVLRMLVLRMDSFHAWMIADSLQYHLPDTGVFDRSTPAPDYKVVRPNVKIETASLPGLGIEAYPIIAANLDEPGRSEFRNLVPTEALEKRMNFGQTLHYNPRGPVQIDGHTYSIAEVPENNMTMSAQVRQDDVPVYTYHMLPHAAVSPIFRLGEYEGKWALEVNGMLIVNGQNMNAAWGYQEIFHWQKLNGKPFFFFVKDGKTGIRYGDQELPGLYDQVFHHYCCEPAQFNVAGNDSMVWYYALKGGVWYFGEAYLEK
jgi:hypothetical protein